LGGTEQNSGRERSLTGGQQNGARSTNTGAATSADEADFAAFFQNATGFAAPYRWQLRIALNGLPEVLPIPTGLGKTEGAVLAWAWRRLRRNLDEPLHLVYCLPMRSLVRQTVERLSGYFERLAAWREFLPVSVHQLMGGAIDEKWESQPDRPWVLVGTQDQLLSRALNRGYAMDRFRWPVHFGLLNQDCQWVIDEVQLMGPGLWTAAQLDWMRRKRFPSLRPCRSTWMSATIGTGFLATTDRKNDGVDHFLPFDPQFQNDQSRELKSRLSAKRPVERVAASRGKSAGAAHAAIAVKARQEHEEHGSGTLTLIVCNTVKTAQELFQSLGEDGPPKILLTSRFRPCDRHKAEQQLIDFEARRRKTESGRIDGDPGLICVSTQVVEAGVDISSHRLWSEIAPWPSVIQRLGRLNRDGRDSDARAYFWADAKANSYRRDGDNWIGPYREKDIKDAEKLIQAAVKPSAAKPFAEAVEIVRQQHGKLLECTFQPRFEPHPRALDVHGLFSTERDVHGGFTDVSRFVRGSDPDADVTVFWRDWPGAEPPGGDALVGPPFDPSEACSVPVYRRADKAPLFTTNSLQDLLGNQGVSAWIWNDETGSWERCSRDELRPGMTIMLRGDAGGYNQKLGWTGQRTDKLRGLPPPGPGRALNDDERTETGYWSRLDVHLRDARSEAEAICDGVKLGIADEGEKLIRTAVVEAAGWHDLGKAHPEWQRKLPAQMAGIPDPLAKSPPVLRVHAGANDPDIERVVRELCPTAQRLAAPSQTKPGELVLRWALSRKLSRDERERLRNVASVRRVIHEPFRPGLRHEAASALAMWRHYRDGGAPYPALAVYLAAAHHGKVRTVLRTLSADGSDVFGVPRQSVELEFLGKAWPLDFSIAADGADGEWSDSGFILKDYGWTGLVADLLGPWRGAGATDTGAVPEGEPRRLGPFVLAWLEALVRVADWRASNTPSHSVSPKAK
jgi:CRISPR-associated endonuclease/helicase Cas3